MGITSMHNNNKPTISNKSLHGDQYRAAVHYKLL